MNTEQVSLFQLYGAGKVKKLDLFEYFFSTKWFRGGSAGVLCVLLAFADQISVFKTAGVFYLLLLMTTAMLFTEFQTNPGLVFLLLALTVVSFNMSLQNTD